MISKVTYTSNLKTIISLFLVYFSVAILGLIAITIHSDFDILLLFNFFESIFFSVLIILFISFFKKSKFKRLIYYLFFTVFLFNIYIETVYFIIYRSYFSPSSIFLFFDSNPQEATEFLSFYFSTPLLIFTCIVLIVYFLCLKQLQLIYPQLIAQNKKNYIYSFSLILLLLGFMRITKLIDYNNMAHD